MKSDVTYKLNNIQKGWKYKAARYAILSRFYGTSWHKDIKGAMKNLRYRWYARLREYFNLEFERLKIWNRYITARNCPPFGFIEQPVLLCELGGMLCPFCYARNYVIKAYNYLEKVLYGGTKYLDSNNKLIRAPDGVRLIEFEAKYQITSNKDWNFKYLCDALVKCRHSIRTLRDREMNLFPDPCGIVMWRLEPLADSLLVRRSGIILTKSQISKNFILEESPGFTFSYTEHPEPNQTYLTKKTLGLAVSRVCSYPMGLFNSSADEALATLKYMRSIRLFSSYGCSSKKYLLNSGVRDG